MILDDFNIEVNKDMVFNVLDCKKDSRVYDDVNKVYEKMLQKAYKLVQPKAIFDIRKRPEEYDFKPLNNCTQVAFCLVTVGDEIQKVIEKAFADGEYLEGMVLDAIGGRILFNLSGIVHESIMDKAKELGVGLTARVSPGENDVRIQLQKDILERLSGREKLNIDITEGYMLDPVKSLAYVYGVDKDLPLTGLDHDCSMCGNIDCKYRNVMYVNIDVITKDGTRSIKGLKSKSILKSLNENKIKIDAPCNGNGTCGKCKIKVVDGDIEPTSNEKKLLTEKELEKGIRLACCTYPKKDMVIKVEGFDDEDFDILSNYNSKELVGDSLIQVKRVDAVEGDLENQISLVAKIKENLKKDYEFSLNSIKKLSTSVNDKNPYGDFTLKGENEYNLIISGNEVIDIQKINNTSAYGITVDIGTTTVAIALVDFINKKTLGTHTVLNSQRQYGADVISRIQYSTNEDSKALTNCIKEDLLNGIKKICEMYGIDYERIFDVAITGNTTMLYLLLGIPAQSLAQSPFTTVTTDLLKYSFKEVFDSDILSCKVTISPCISAYVGADIVTGMLNCNYHDLDGIKVLIDIGTNGEMVIGDGEKIYCAATAAGPAFEGANIKNGTGSIKGAVCSVNIEDEKIDYKTIGNKKPVGICGSAVLDIVSEGLKSGLISSTGRFNKCVQDKRIEIYKDEEKDISFYQKDVRELQLAKSAIRAGLEILIKKFECSYDDIDTLYLAGGFGNNLNIDSAVNIGLIPKELKDKVELVGNSSLGGTVDYLLDNNSKKHIEEIIKKSRYFELSAVNEFNDLFIEHMSF